MSGPTQDELNREAIKQGIRTRADAIKQQLFRWIGQNSGPADAMPMTIALLEIAIKGHLQITENENRHAEFPHQNFSACRPQAEREVAMTAALPVPASAEVLDAAGHRDPSTTKLYDRARL